MEFQNCIFVLSEPTKLISAIKGLKPIIPDFAYNIESKNYKVVQDMQYGPQRDADVTMGENDEGGNPK